MHASCTLEPFLQFRIVCAGPFTFQCPTKEEPSRLAIVRPPTESADMMKRLVAATIDPSEGKDSGGGSGGGGTTVFKQNATGDAPAQSFCSKI